MQRHSGLRGALASPSWHPEDYDVDEEVGRSRRRGAGEGLIPSWENESLSSTQRKNLLPAQGIRPGPGCRGL